jgi:hypothetical protein
LEKKKFTDLIVRQKSHQLFLAVVEDVERFPKKRAATIGGKRRLETITPPNLPLT